MNMQKGGIVSQSKQRSKIAKNAMKSSLLPIHYAKTRPTQGGIVGGTVSRFTYRQLPARQQIAAASYPDWSTTIRQRYWHLRYARAFNSAF